MAKLPQICNFRPKVFGRVLDVISHHIQQKLPSPALMQSGLIPRSTLKEESLVILSWVIIGGASLEPWFDQETRQNLLSKFHTQLTDHLRWMLHLFTYWVLDLRRFGLGLSRRTDVAHASDSLPATASKTRLNVLTLVTHILALMTGEPDLSKAIVGQMKDEEQIGSLLAQMTIVAICNDDVQMIMRCFVTLRALHDDVAYDPLPEPCETGFIRTLESHIHLWADAIVSQITNHSWTSTSHCSNNFRVLLDVLFECFSCPGRDILLDACLTHERTGTMIGDLTMSFDIAIECLKCRRIPQPDVDSHNFSIISHIVHLLIRIFIRGGPALIHIAMKDQRMFSAIQTLLEVPLLEHGMEAIYYDGLDEVITSLVDTILPFLVYPRVFTPMCQIFVDFGWTLGRRMRNPSKMIKAKESLARVSIMIGDEAYIRDRYLKAQQMETSVYTDTYKFCDNPRCPFRDKVTKLGRCAACWYGYYCSPYCQRAMWKYGHRDECKLIVDSMREGSKESFPLFPPIHEREYLKRTLVPRLHYWRETVLKNNPGQIVIKSKAYLNLVDFPVAVKWYDDSDPDKPKDAPPGTSITGLFPTGGVAGKVLSVSVASDPRKVAVKKHQK